MLESLTLQGFKSFEKRSRLEFQGGICAIIGPNGSGKSNVVEALRWVTQQARSRELRAGKATELIFHGAGNKAALGVAEVELELALPQGHLSLARRLYSDGSGEQELMGKPARVKDIHAALRGTGLGPGGLAIIGQGEVSRVVQAEGRTLLGYVQEAAGLSRAVSARQDAEAQLQVADLALGDLEREEEQLRAQLSQLEREAAQAARERQTRLRLLSLEDSLLRARQEALLADISQLRQRAREQARESQELGREIEFGAAQLEEARQVTQRLRGEQAAHLQAQELLRAAKRAAEQQRLYAQHLEREAAEARRDLAALPQEAPAQAESAPLGAELAEVRAQLSRLEEEERRLSREREEELKRAQAQARAQAQRDTWAAEEARLLAQRDADAPELEAARKEQSAAEQELRLARERREAQALAQARRAQLARELEALALQLRPLRAEALRLGQALDSYARYGEGPRHALQSDHAGIVGSVADLLEVPAKHEVALQAALGRRLEQVVVRSAADAQDLIALLKRLSGRATFLPLELLRARPRRDAALLARAGVVGNLADLCPSDPPLVSEALLADTLLLESLPQATALARAFAARPRLVTLEGEVIEPLGSVSGGRGGATFSVLADQRRYHDLQDEIEALQGQRAALEAELARLLVPEAPPLTPLEQRAQQAEKRVTRLEATAQARLERLDEVRQRQRETPAPTLPPDAPDGTPLLALREEISALRGRERDLQKALEEAREQERLFQQWLSAQERRAELQERLRRSETAAAQAAAQLAAQEDEVRGRAEQVGAAPDLERAQERERQLSARYGELVARQNRLRAALEDTRLNVARREGSLQPISAGARLPGEARE